MRLLAILLTLGNLAPPTLTNASPTGQIRPQELERLCSTSVDVDFTYTGKNIEKTDNRTFLDCCQSCSQKAECSAFSWNSKNGSCHHKAAIGEKLAQTGIHSSVTQCLSKLLDSNDVCALEKSPGCKYDPSAYDKTNTISGTQCQNWAVDTPHSHSFNHLGNDTKCRNPDRGEQPWCYTTDVNKRWEYCYPICKNSLCFQAPTWRKDDPNMEVVKRRKWEREPVCKKMDGKYFLYKASSWFIDDVKVSVENVDAIGMVTFLIENDTPRDFETLKFRVIKSDSSQSPVELEVGQVTQFTHYRFNSSVDGVSNKEDMASFHVILPFTFYKVGIEGFEGSCSWNASHGPINVANEKSYAHAFATMKYTLNSPEFRRRFLIDFHAGKGWMERQHHLDWILTVDKYKMRIKHLRSGAGGFGAFGGRWLSVIFWRNNLYTMYYFTGFSRILYHEAAHNWGYSHSDFPLLMQTPFEDQLYEFNKQCVMQDTIAAQERYTDYVGISAVYNPTDKVVYLFSGESFRILSFKNWKDSMPVDPCVLTESKTGEMCAVYDSASCKIGLKNNKTTTQRGITCQQWNRNSPHWHRFGRLGDNNNCNNPDGTPAPWCYTTNKNYRWDYCYPKCSGDTWMNYVEKTRLCVRYDETCAWNEEENCRRYGAYTGTKTTTVEGEECKAWAETKFPKFPGNACRASPGYGPWCYKQSGGWGYCFQTCNDIMSMTPRLPNNDKLAGCVDHGRSCAWNGFAKCVSSANEFNKMTTWNGEPCRNGTKCKSGDGYAPRCYKESDNTKWELCYPDCQANLCINADGSCIHNYDTVCKDAGNMIFNKMTTRPDAQCISEENGGKCASSPGYAPWCHYFHNKTSGEKKWDYCYQTCTSQSCFKSDQSCAWRKRDVCYGKPYGKYKECYEPSDDERTLVEKVFSDVEAGVKFAFLDTSGSAPLLAILPFNRGMKPDQDKLLYYTLDQKNLKLEFKKPLKDVLGGLWGAGRTLFNPQFLQGVGVFHGAEFCPFTGDIISPCSNVYTDPKWSFLKKFSGGPADLDLVFDGGHGKAFFFKDKQFIGFDLSSQKMVAGYPKPVKDLLRHFGLNGGTFITLS